MLFLTSSLALDITISLVVLLYFFYRFYARKYDYWKKRGVPYVEPKFPLGTLKINLIGDKPHYGKIDKDIYDAFKDEKYVGIFALSEPQLFVRDLDVLKHILIKDFSSFVDRGMFAYVKEDFCGQHLFNMEGDSWKQMRAKLSPTFTSGRMKNMFTLIQVIADQLHDHVEQLAEKKATVPFKELIAKFTVDTIATCAFGVEVNTLKNPVNIMSQMAKLNSQQSWQRYTRAFILQHMHWLAKLLKIFQTRPALAYFCRDLVRDTMDYRKKNNVTRNDFIDLLTKVRNRTLDNEGATANGKHANGKEPDVDEDMTLDVMAAQTFVFFAAGYDTASSTSSFCFYELAQHQDIQEKVRQEIDEVLEKNGGVVTYQCLSELHYMEMCINETLRRYASVPFLRRRCNTTYRIPDTDLVLEAGTMITIPAYAIHHDPDIYPDPYTFDPERFSEENVKSRHHCAHLPFGDGPRICIGKRLGLMQVKMAVVTILKDYVVSPSPHLPQVLPLDHRSILTTSAVPIDLIITKRP